MDEQLTFEFAKRPTIKGFPELRWTGKRPFDSTQYFPAQLRERYGEEVNGWINKIFWGDNLQVMSHLLKKYRGQVDLIYIDPPYDSKADYKKKIKLKGFKETFSDISSFEEKQYGDIWVNDEYLQFMYERIILLKELLSEQGTLFVHCDWHKSQYIRCLLDEIMGYQNMRNEIIWHYDIGTSPKDDLKRKHDVIYRYVKSKTFKFNSIRISAKNEDRYNLVDENGRKYMIRGDSGKIVYADEGQNEDDVWTYYKDDKLRTLNSMAKERTEINYPTQKPETLIERIIQMSSNPSDLVFDCFMGSGTTQAVAMKLGRRFIGADINLGAIQTTTKRLINVASELQPTLDDTDVKYTGFEVYNVNNYDFFRNPVEARELIIQALEIQPFEQSNVWDGELDGRMVKIMPVNRIATKADLEELKANLPYKTYEKRKEDNPRQPVEKITIVCMGHEPDLKASLEAELKTMGFTVDVEIYDILRNKAELELKREAEAEVVREGSKLVIRAFYPMNLLQKLSLQKEYVENWRQLVESIMIDWNYDGVVMQPAVTDVPDKKSLVVGVYDIPDDAGTIKVKITDLLSESLEVEV